MSARSLWHESQSSHETQTQITYILGVNPPSSPSQHKKNSGRAYALHCAFLQLSYLAITRARQNGSTLIPRQEESSFVLALFQNKQNPTEYVFPCVAALSNVFNFTILPLCLHLETRSSVLYPHTTACRLYFSNYHVQLTAFAAATSRCVAANSPSPNYPAMSSTATTTVLNNTTLSNQTPAHHYLTTSDNSHWT